MRQFKQIPIQSIVRFVLVGIFCGCSSPTFEPSKSRSAEENIFFNLLVTGLVTYQSTSVFDSYAEKNLDWSRFLGTWNEIQRIDNSFQSGLREVSAEYSLSNDGSIRVLNRGVDPTGNRNQIEGKALLIHPDVGKLKVSFFYPFFFGDYLVLKIDRIDYSTALIGGPDPNFLWVFSKTNSIPTEVESDYIEYAKTIGYSTDRLQSFR
ncbi:lipocalin family protein [Leptospira terpstrae]|uniref:lipocalin family protein n=1 Tax=Leptospira terpstrae TaxID=293075 RepID=UPI003D02B963